MKKFTKILSGMLAVTLATSAFAGLTVANAEALTLSKEIMLYENDFDSADDISRVSYQDISTKNGANGTVSIEDGKLVQRNVTGNWHLAAAPSYSCGNGQLTIQFEPQETGILVVELDRGWASGIADNGKGCSGYDGVLNLVAENGTRVAGIFANGRGQNGAKAWENGAWTNNNTEGYLNNINWMYGTTIKYEINLDTNTYKVYQGGNLLATATTKRNTFAFTADNVAKLVYNYSCNGETVDNIKIYKKLSATQNFTDYTIVKGDTNWYSLNNINAITGVPVNQFNLERNFGNVLDYDSFIKSFMALNVGTATLTATHKEYSDIKFTFNIHVKNPATGVAITGDTHDMYIGQTKQLEYSLTPADSAVSSLTWSSSNTGVATVDQNGLVTATTTEGTTTITASATVPGGTLTDTYTVNVSVPQNALAITGDSRVMVGSTLQLSASPAVVGFTPDNISWSLDSYPTGTTIDATTGVISAGAVAGNGVAKASCFGGLVTATFNFEVYAPADGLTVRDNQGTYELDLDTNNQIELDSIILGGFTPDAISWTKGADPTNSITLTPNGSKVIIAANAINTTGVTVTVSCYSGTVSDTCTIKVHRGVGTITVTGSDTVLNIGDRATLTGAWANSDTTINTATALSWRSGNHYVATVSGSGTSAVVTAVGAGTTQIYYMGAGQQGSFTVTGNPRTDADGNIIEDTRTPSRVSFAEVKGSFADIADMAWAQAAIQSVYAKGIMTPDSEYSFGAKRNIKRDEFVSVVIKTLGLEGVASEEAKKFDDVDESNPYYAEIMKAVELGIIAGVSETSFAPGDDITRQDLSVVVMKALEVAKVSIVEGRLDFNDKADIAEYAQKAVRVLSKMNIMVGKDGGIFDPRANTTRAEAAIISEKIDAIR